MSHSRNFEADAPGSRAPILTIADLRVALPKGADRSFAVERASLDLRRGESLGIVGESGSGKSALAGAIMGAPPPGLRGSTGSIKLNGEELTTVSERAWCRVRGNRLAMIFQEPTAARNPAICVGRQINELLELHGSLGAQERRARACTHTFHAAARC